MILASVLIVLAFAAFGQTGSSANWSTALDSATFLKLDTIEKNAPQSLLLIGENHASVKTQQQLAELLEKLYKEQRLDAILVEGSYGPIEGETLRRKLNLMKVSNLGRFWRGQLDLGQIAGYEYVALTQKDVKAYGIESMDAKDAYIIESVPRQTLAGFATLIDRHRRALALAKAAAADLDTNTAQFAAVNESLKNYEGKINEFAALTNAKGNQYAEWLQTRERLAALYRKMGPVREILAKKGAPRTEADLLAAFRSAGYITKEDAIADLNRKKEAEDWLVKNQAEFKRVETALDDLESEIEDQFFITANSIRSAKNSPVLPLQTFLRKELENTRIQNQNQNPEVPYLVDRDQHMIQNIREYLAQNPQVRRAAVIVGYAHVDDLTKLLRQENVNVVAGRIAASTEETEAWENRAWNRRIAPAERVFSTGSRKERSRLQDPVFKQEIPALLAALKAAGGNGIHSGSKQSTKSIIRIPDADSLTANWGSYVVGLGKLPNGAGENYVVVDRNREHQQAKDFTTDKEWMVPAYAQGATTKVGLPDSPDVDIKELLAQVPSRNEKVPERLVLGIEGDPNDIQTALGGGGSDLPPWTTELARFEEPPEKRGPFVFLTKNFGRARGNLDAINKQDPIKIGDVASFEIGFPNGSQTNLDNLWFTPERGDHARVFLIAGDNTPEFRKQLIAAAEAGLLRNKQIALATCFDPKETDGLREKLLENGALMVWTPKNRISPDAARKLGSYMEKVDTAANHPPARGLDEYLDRTLELWHKESPDDTNLDELLNGSRHVELPKLDPSTPPPFMKTLQPPIPANGM
jgi:hypothetical protein